MDTNSHIFPRDPNTKVRDITGAQGLYLQWGN